MIEEIVPRGLRWPGSWTVKLSFHSVTELKGKINMGAERLEIEDKC